MVSKLRIIIWKQVALILGYFVGFVFMECYSVTVHTVVVCFCEDEKYNDGGAEQPYFMSGSLEEVLGPAAQFGKAKDKTKVFLLMLPYNSRSAQLHVLNDLCRRTRSPTSAWSS